MTIHIDRIDDEEMKEWPFFWWIEINGVNKGFGWSKTEKEAVKAASAQYMITHKWED